MRRMLSYNIIADHPIIYYMNDEKLPQSLKQQFNRNKPVIWDDAYTS